jgi:two-component SAPR family response regulator
MNGKELADRITALHPQVKVLFMSGYTGDALGRVGEISDRVLLEKPFTASALIRRVCEVLDGPAGRAPGAPP